MCFFSRVTKCIWNNLIIRKSVRVWNACRNEKVQVKFVTVVFIFIFFFGFIVRTGIDYIRVYTIGQTEWTNRKNYVWVYYSNQKARRKLQLDWLSEIFFALLITSCETYKRKFKYTAAVAAATAAAANIKYKIHCIPKFSPNILYFLLLIAAREEKKENKKERKRDWVFISRQNHCKRLFSLDAIKRDWRSKTSYELSKVQNSKK